MYLQQKVHRKTVKARLLQLSTGLLLTTLSFSLLPLQVAHATPTDALVYSSQWGTEGSGNGQFESPIGTAVDSSGNIYVLDSDNSRVQKFDSSGTYLTEWGSYGGGNSQFSSPEGIAVDSSGNVYVADTANKRIKKFDSSGTYLTQWGTSGSGNGQLNSPRGIVVDSSGNVYVVEFGNNRVQKFDSSGAYLTKWGSAGSGNGQFQFPMGITVDTNGNVYVADTANNRIQKFTSTGTYLTQWGSAGSGNGQFQSPMGLTVDTNGNVYVADTSNNRIQKFTSTGTYLTQWGSAGSGNGQFNGLRGPIIDSSGNLFVGDYNNRIQKFVYPVTSQTFSNNPSSGTATNITLTTAAGTNITAASAVAASSLVADSAHNYPLGLVDFTFTATTGSTTQVQLTFVTTLTPTQVTARKYNSTTHAYADIPGATITETTASGQHALLLSYDITDGGPLDQDGVANGVVVDPVGLAIASATAATTSSNELANTGQPISTALVIIDIVSGLSIAAVSWLVYNSRRQHYIRKG